MHIGIDLGTTHSLIAIYRGGQVELLANALGHVLTPSAVSLAPDGSLLVGLAAREAQATRPDATATAFKRWMGTDRRQYLGNRSFRPEELSGIVLQSLKQDAEARLGAAVTDVVITVPAYFNNTQRQATLHAAELAGLKVSRLLNEPTAAGLAYGLQERKDHTVFLVFDLGGGTFDVSVLEYFDGVVQVRASAGDTRLGGEDFVTELGQLFLRAFPDLTANERDQVARGLWRTAEQAKRDLTDHTSARMACSMGKRRLELDITRGEFEAACQHLLERLRHPIERALHDARLEPGELNEVLLVGGATRMPMIRHLVTRLFQRLPLRTIDPDEVIARGAAIQAALVARDAALEDVVLTDVMPYSLGVIVSSEVNGRVMNDLFSPIIERNTPVPVSRVANYQTMQDNQTRIRLDIRQGESPIGSENLFLGELEIKVPPRPAGSVNVDVRMSYDISGVLVVDVKHDEGETHSLVIRQTEQGMSEVEMATALARLDKLKIHPREQQENLYLVERAKRLYGDLLGDPRGQVQQHISAFLQALDSQEERIIIQARKAFREFLDRMDAGFRL